MALSPASSPKTLREFSRARLASGPCPCACPQGRGRCGNPEMHRVNSHPAPPCTKFCAFSRFRESGTSAGCKKAVAHVCSPRRCCFATTRPLGAQIPRHVCTCENVLWFVGRMPPFSCCVAHSLRRLRRPETTCPRQPEVWTRCVCCAGSRERGCSRSTRCFGGISCTDTYCELCTICMLHDACCVLYRPLRIR